MLSILKGETVRTILLMLPRELRVKFAMPRFPRPTADFVGETEQQILSSLIMNIAYTEDNLLDGVPRDGNILEPMSWIGLEETDYQTILDKMRTVGWQPNMDRF